MFLRKPLNLLKIRFLLINKLNKRLINNELMSKESNVFHMKLKTCQELYNKNRQSLTKWHLRSGPKLGIEVNVEYVDTKPNDPKSRTLVALHGSPGSHEDFRQLIRHFGHRFRVIVPNFPDFSLTEETNYFWHSAEEKAQYIRDILKELNVSEIDCLISHSAAIFPTSYLWLKDNELNKGLVIKSLCLLSPPGPKWINWKNKINLCIFINISRFKIIRTFLQSIWSERLTYFFGTKNRIANYDRLALLWSTVYMSETNSVAQRLKMLSQLKIPTLFLFTYRDKLFNKEIFYDELRILGADRNNFEVYEEHENILIQKAKNDDWLKVVNIRSGGHYCFVTHSKLVHKYIEELLEKVQ